MPKRKKDKSEAWAEEYLRYRGFKTVTFEPDGNVPPDFLVEGRIAVEVRRLNQHWQADSGDLEPVEKLAVPLVKHLKEILKEFGPPLHGVSWFVSCEFRRPQETKKWKPILRRELQPYRDGTIQDRSGIIRIDPSFSLHLTQVPADSSVFIYGGESDLDEGGWVISELETNLPICIKDKSSKIAGYRERYQEWWLVLIDHMMSGQRENVHVEHDWDKVLIIHPYNWDLAYELVNRARRS